MINNLIFSINIVAPVFLIVLVGVWLKRIRLIDDHFIKMSSRLIFQVTMPALVFVKIAATNFQQVFNGRLILFTYVAIFLAFTVAWLCGVLLAPDGRDRGAFIQGSFRGNFAILGFAMIQSAFGKEPLANAAILLSFIMPPYNLLSIIALTVTQRGERHIPWQQTAKEVVTNPLILAAAVAVPFSYFAISVPKIVFEAVDQLSTITLPMALIGIGASLSFSGIRQDLRLAAAASCLKLVVTPLLTMMVAVRMHFTTHELAALYFFFASPAAIASFIMAHAMGSNGRLAGHIVLLSTLASSLTISLGIFLLKSWGYF